MHFVPLYQALVSGLGTTSFYLVNFCCAQVTYLNVSVLMELVLSATELVVNATELVLNAS